MNIRDDREYGRASNIPECCIDFYINEWVDKLPHEHREAMHAKGYIGYVACPDCLKKEHFNNLFLNEGGEKIPLILGWKYRQKPTGEIWTLLYIVGDLFTMQCIKMVSPSGNVHDFYFDQVQNLFERV